MTASKITCAAAEDSKRLMAHVNTGLVQQFLNIQITQGKTGQNQGGVLDNVFP